MSCRSNILIEQPDSSYLGIYCHHDGYIDHNGAILNASYKDRTKVEDLINLGDLSELKANISDDGDNHCIAYTRDLGVGGVTNAMKYNSLEELDDFSTNWCEINYIFTKENTWKYFETGELQNGLINLAEAVKASQQANVFGGAAK